MISHSLRISTISFLTVALATPIAQSQEVVDADRAFRMHCEQSLPRTSVRVTAPAGEIVYRYSESVLQLTQRSLEHVQPGTAQSIFGKGQHTLGLTESRYRYASEVRSPILVQEKTGFACMRPQIAIEISTGPQTVSVAREFAQNSCGFNEILRHELRHARANQSVASEISAFVQRQMTAYYGQTVFYGTHDELTRSMSEASQKRWLDQIDEGMQRVNALHAAIDSPEELGRMHVTCGGEIPLRLRAAGLQ